MNLKPNLVLLALCIVDLVLGKMEIILDEKLEDCSDPEDAAGLFDLSDFEMIAETDTSISLNGTIRFRKDVQAPWKVFGYGETYDRATWSKRAERTIPDFCQVMHTPTEQWFPYFKDQPGCPYKAGDEYKYNMVPVVTKNLPIIIPPNFVGKWRATINLSNDINGSEKRECWRTFFDVVEAFGIK